MRRHSVLRTIRMKLPGVTTVGALLLVIGFLVGGFAALSYADLCDADSRAALSEYLYDYCTLHEQGGETVSFWNCVRLYFGSVFLAFLFGFSSLGTVLTPLLSVFLGFTSFYTVSCFTLTFGRPGVYAAASLIAVRLFFTIPCFFAVASLSWCISYRLAAMMVGQGKRSEHIRYSGRYFLTFVFCLVLLSVGVCCERLLSPRLFRAVIDRIGFIF